MPSKSAKKVCKEAKARSVKRKGKKNWKKKERHKKETSITPDILKDYTQPTSEQRRVWQQYQ